MAHACGVDDVSGCTSQAAYTDKIQRRGLQFWAIFLTFAYQCVEKDELNLWDTCVMPQNKNAPKGVMPQK